MKMIILYRKQSKLDPRIHNVEFVVNWFMTKTQTIKYLTFRETTLIHYVLNKHLIYLAELRCN